MSDYVTGDRVRVRADVAPAGNYEGTVVLVAADGRYRVCVRFPTWKHDKPMAFNPDELELVRHAQPGDSRVLVTL